MCRAERLAKCRPSGGCSLARACGRSLAPNAPSPMYPTSAHLEIAQQLNDVTAPLYGLIDGGGSALAALPILFSTSGDAAGVS